MKGPKDAKRYVALYWRGLKRIHWDDLAIFKWERCKKWRKQNRRPRDGSHGTVASYIERS
jgi:hypothetical protein